MARNRCKLLPSQYHQIVGREVGSVLLETARFDAENTHSYLFLKPAEILSIQHPDEAPALFAKIEANLKKGRFVAGYFGYECGYHFENIGVRAQVANGPLAWFGVYDAPLVFDHSVGAFEGAAPQLQHSPQGEDFCTDHLRFCIAHDEYTSKIAAIKDYIAAGDTYQVNFTDEYQFDFSGPAATLFSRLRTSQRVSYSAFLNLGDSCVLSLSPELFFRIKDGKIITRPMKGTAPRGRTLQEDREISTWLRNDLKNRSENVMIVDLLRNDVGRICEPGSVLVDELFVVEKYDTLFQMTSTVSGTLKQDLSLNEIFRAVFPSGSVTGAPKVRTMQIIRELERRPRGIYTGAIGYFAPNGDAAFNVAIRTVVLRSGHGNLGVGGGIVFDSVAEKEYEECCLKAEFLTAPAMGDFKLIETILWDGGYPLLPLHLERLRTSAEYFDFGFDEHAICALLAENERKLKPGVRTKVRLLLDRTGELHLENSVAEPWAESGTVVLSPVRTSSQDRFLYHKTTCRELYRRMHAAARQQGHVDVIFLNEKDEVTEGAISTVFVEKDGWLLTPPIASGLLPGVFRAHLLATRQRVREQVLSRRDLEQAEAIYLANAVRGIQKVAFVEDMNWST